MDRKILIGMAIIMAVLLLTVPAIASAKPTSACENRQDNAPQTTRSRGRIIHYTWPHESVCEGVFNGSVSG